MRHDEFLGKFYRRSGERPLGSIKSQNDVGAFFVKNALPTIYHSDFLPTEPSTYGKWLKPNNLPGSRLMKKMQESFDSERLQRELCKNLNPVLLGAVMQSFDLSCQGDEDKERFAAAIVSQYKAIIIGEGKSTNIVPAEYQKHPELAGYDYYLSLAAKKYKYMHLPGEDDCLLADYFVYNDIGTASVVFPRRTRAKVIQRATLEHIRTYDRRGETRCVILIGACGFGKTLMLQQLFLDSRLKYDQTGLLPVFAELRNFSDRYDDFIDFIVDTIHEFDTSFTLESAKGLLKKGSIQLLLDGLDELDPDEVNHFQKKLLELCSRYPYNQVVITSRQCSAINGFRGFNRLYLQPLDNEQIEKLIDKLLSEEKDPKAKEIILSLLDTKTGYVAKNSFIASNPLLLTIIVKNYRKLCSFKGDRIKFYDLLYYELIRGHDEEKPAFDRIFHSVANGEEFTDVYREFCAQAYVDGVDAFDQRLFEKYFKQLRSKVALRNPEAFQLHAFQHDVCATACMMYEQETDIFYIDHGFQDYFFAEYFYHADSEPTKAMGQIIESRNIDSFRNLNALRMLYSMAKEKVEVCLLLPYLEKIFKGKNEDEAYISFLEYGFGNVIYTAIDEKLAYKYAERFKPRELTLTPAANHVHSITMAFILDILNLPNNFILGVRTSPLLSDNNTTFFFVCFALAVKENPDTPGYWLLQGVKKDIKTIGDDDYYINAPEPMPILDDNEKPLCIGYEYSIPPKELMSRPDILELIQQHGEGTTPDDIFIGLRDYYERLSDEQEKNKYQ